MGREKLLRSMFDQGRVGDSYSRLKGDTGGRGALNMQPSMNMPTDMMRQETWHIVSQYSGSQCISCLDQYSA